jgi:cytochrome b subunit of formate dehydrogenase
VPIAPSCFEVNERSKRGHTMPEREGRKVFFLLQAMFAALFLIVGVAVAIEAASGGYGIGLLVVSAMANEVAFFILAALFAATAMHLRP